MAKDNAHLLFSAQRVPIFDLMEDIRRPMMGSHEYYMKAALQEAKKAFEEDEIPIGAVVVSNDKIIARGHNMTEQLNDATAHAEMMALTAAFSHLGGKYLPECTLYVTIEPCLMCAGALYWSKIGAIIYGAKDDKNGYRRHMQMTDDANKKEPFHPKTRLLSGIAADECAQLMKDFFLSKR